MDCSLEAKKLTLIEALRHHQILVRQTTVAVGDSVSDDLPANYLKASRTLGYAQTIKMKRNIDDLRKNSIRLLVLIEVINLESRKTENISFFL